MLVDVLSRFCGRLAGWGFVLVFALTVYEVASRYLFGAPTIWTLETSILLGGLGYLFAGPMTLQERGHIRVETLYARLGTGTQRVLDRVADVLSILYGAAIFYAGLLIAIPSIRAGERTGSAFNSPEPLILKVAIVAAAALFGLQAAANLIATRRRARA